MIKKRKDQLKNFTAELNRKSSKKYNEPKDWIEAFNILQINRRESPRALAVG